MANCNEVNIAAEIRQSRKCIELADDSHYKVAFLCDAYNWATSPSRFMDDKECRVCGKFARAIRRKLRRYSGWRECDSGRLLAS